MAKDILSEPQFNDEEAARKWFEAARWNSKPVCPHCKGEKHYATKKAGRYRCGNAACRKDFTVMTGSVMERSHVKLTLWAKAFYLFASSKKGFAAHQLHRALGCEYNTAWFLHHRVMEAMRRGGLDLPPLGGSGKIVEADETYYGPVAQPRTKNAQGKPYGGRGPQNKRVIVSLTERGGDVRSFHVPFATKEKVMGIVRANVDRESRLFTDESHHYHGASKDFAEHSTVTHSKKEYARGEVSTNTIEGFFGIFKRGMRGVYQHCSEKNLHRYVAEFDYRYSTRHLSDVERTILAIKGGEGKRLTYHPPH